MALGLNPILVRVLMMRSYLPIHAGLGVDKEALTCPVVLVGRTTDVADRYGVRPDLYMTE